LLVDSIRVPKDNRTTVRIGFPVKCHYRGGHKSLGTHGAHLWISRGEIGYGELNLTHGIPLTAVSGIDVKEREFGGSDAQAFFSAGVGFGGLRRGCGPPATAPKVMTDVNVRTNDGQEALWVVEEHGAAWVRERLTSVLRQVRIPYDDDLPPRDWAG
jgi:hypothetical protein